MPAFPSSTPSALPRSAKWNVRPPCAIAPGGGYVDVEAVRILVVRDVEVGAAVAVDVGEHGAEAVLEVRALEAGLDADLAEPRAPVRVVPLVEEEQVAHALVVRREAGDGVLDRRVRIGVPGDEEVGPTVAVDVGDGGARVPAERDDARPAARPR